MSTSRSEVARMPAREGEVSLVARRARVGLGWSLLAVALLVGCGDEGGSTGEEPAECPGVLADARCLKACGLAVETASTRGIQYQVVGEDGHVQAVTNPEVFYTLAGFTVSGGRVSLALPHAVLEELDAGRLATPVCVGLSLTGGSDGLAQYLPAQNTFSTDGEHRGEVALIEYEPGSRVLEGIFSFTAVLQGGGGAGAGSGDLWTTRIEQGWFRAAPR